MGELQLQQWAEQLERERDAARAELARVRAERDALQQQTMYDIALFGDEKLKAELAGARARLALVEPVVSWAEVVADEASYTEDNQAMCIDPAHMSELRHRLAALDAAPPSSEPTKPLHYIASAYEGEQSGDAVLECACGFQAAGEHWEWAGTKFDQHLHELRGDELPDEPPATGVGVDGKQPMPTDATVTNIELPRALQVVAFKSTTRSAYDKAAYEVEVHGYVTDVTNGERTRVRTRGVSAGPPTAAYLHELLLTWWDHELREQLRLDPHQVGDGTFTAQMFATKPPADTGNHNSSQIVNAERVGVLEAALYKARTVVHGSAFGAKDEEVIEARLDVLRTIDAALSGTPAVSTQPVTDGQPSEKAKQLVRRLLDDYWHFYKAEPGSIEADELAKRRVRSRNELLRYIAELEQPGSTGDGNRVREAVLAEIEDMEHQADVDEASGGECNAAAAFALRDAVKLLRTALQPDSGAARQEPDNVRKQRDEVIEAQRLQVLDNLRLQRERDAARSEAEDAKEAFRSAWTRAETAEHQLGEAVEWLDHWKTSGVEPAGVDDWLDERSAGAAATAAARTGEPQGRPDLCRYPADSCSCCRCSRECIASGAHHQRAAAPPSPSTAEGRDGDGSPEAVNRATMEWLTRERDALNAEVAALKAENERLQQTVADANASYRIMCDAHESARLEITRLERGNIDLAADLAAEREKVERMTGALEDAVELLDTLRHWGHENNCKSEDDQPCNCVIAENDRVSIAARAALAGTAGKPGKETL